jgi:hypothetical protein
MELPPLSNYLPSAYYGAEKEMDTILAPTRVDAAGNVDTRSVLERSQAAGLDDTGTNHEGRVGKSTYDMMLGSRLTFISTEAGDVIGAMQEKFADKMTEIAIKDPSLIGKDWDFTINDENEIEIIDNKNVLSDEDKYFLKKELSAFEDDFADYADAISVMSQQVSEQDFNMPALGEYNITRENFSEFFRGREFMAADKEASFGMTGVIHMPALYAQLAERGEGLKIAQEPKVDIKV